MWFVCAFVCICARARRYDGYVRDVAQMLHQFAADADNKAAFVAACSARAFTLRFGENDEEKSARYQQMFFDAGKLVVRCQPNHFRTNM